MKRSLLKCAALSAAIGIAAPAYAAPITMTVKATITGRSIQPGVVDYSVAGQKASGSITFNITDATKIEKLADRDLATAQWHAAGGCRYLKNGACSPAFNDGPIGNSLVTSYTFDALGATYHSGVQLSQPFHSSTGFIYKERSGSGKQNLNIASIEQYDNESYFRIGSDQSGYSSFSESQSLGISLSGWEDRLFGDINDPFAPIKLDGLSAGNFSFSRTGKSCNGSQLTGIHCTESPGNFSLYMKIDEISFAPGQAALPVPGTPALIGLGLAGLIFARRKEGQAGKWSISNAA